MVPRTWLKERRMFTQSIFPAHVHSTLIFCATARVRIETTLHGNHRFSASVQVYFKA